jgi:hypothetical protein
VYGVTKGGRISGDVAIAQVLRSEGPEYRPKAYGSVLILSWF